MAYPLELIRRDLDRSKAKRQWWPRLVNALRNKSGEGVPPAEPSRCMLMEPLEPRLLLSADLGTAGLDDALDAGLQAFSDRVMDFLETEALLNTALPLMVVPEAGGSPGQILNGAATIADLLSVTVDQDGDGVIDAGVETQLDQFDAFNKDGTLGKDGFVGFKDFFLGGFVNKIKDVGDGLSDYASTHSGATLDDYFNQSLFDQTVGPLVLAVSATDTSDANQVSADLSVTLSFSDSLPLDLGLGADALGMSLSSELDFTASLAFQLDLGVLTSGEVANDADFFVETGSFTAKVKADANLVGTGFNIGFLGAQITGDGTTTGIIDLTAQAQVSLDDPRTPSELGFTSFTSGTGSITAGASAGNTLTGDAGFILRIGDTDAREVVLDAADTTGNSSLTDLESDLQAAIDSAGFDGVVTVGDDGGGHLKLSLANTDITPLGFGLNELFNAGGTLTATTALTDAQADGLTGNIQFLLSLAGAVPKLIVVDADAVTTVDQLVTHINDALSIAGVGLLVDASKTGAGKIELKTVGAAAGDSLRVTQKIALDNKVTLGDLESAASVADLVSAPDTTGSHLTVNLPIAVTAGLGFSPGGVVISYSGNPFSAGSTLSDADGNVRYDLPFTAANFDELANFNNLSASSFVSLVGQIGAWLDKLRQSDLISGVDIPLVGGNLGDVLDFADMIRDTLLFDDGDDGVNSGKELITDINKALLDAGLDGQIRAEASGGNIRLVAIDDSVASFSVTTSSAFGFVAESAALSGGVLSLTGNNAVPDLTFNTDQTFKIVINGAPAVTVTLTAAATADNTSLDNDVAKLLTENNTANFTTAQELASKLAAILGVSPAATYDASTDELTYSLVLHDDFISKTLPVDFSLDLAPLLNLSSDSTVQVSASGDLTLTLGVYLGDASSNSLLTNSTALADLFDVAALLKTAPAITGASDASTTALSGDASFDVAINGDTAVTVTVAATATANNKNILDLVNDVTKALADAHLDDQISASSVGNRLLLTAKTGVTSFSLTAAAGNVLGFGASQTANSDDLRITTRSGDTHYVDLDGAVTIGDVIAKIEAQTGSAIDVAIAVDDPDTPQDEAGTRLILTDAISGSNLFQVATHNGSAIGIALGIVGVDSTTLAERDGVIEGGTLGGLKLADRLFIEDAVISAQAAVTTPELAPGDGDGDSNDGINASAQFGFVSVDLHGGGSFSADLSAGIKGADGTVGGRITLAELAAGLSDIASIVETPTLTASGSLELEVNVNPSFTDFALSGSAPTVTITVNDLGDPFAGTPVLPDISVSTSGFDNLLRFDDIGFSDILGGLRALGDFLADFESFGFLSEDLPLIGLSVNDLLSFADRFATAVDDLAANPAGTLQMLEAKLEEALGISSDVIDFVLETVDSDTLFRVNLDLGTSFAKSLGVNFDLSDYIDLPPELGDAVQLAGAAGLQASGTLDFELDFGFNLADPSEVYLFDETGLSANLTAGGNDLTFRAALGPLGLYITGGSANVTVGVDAGIESSLFENGRVLLADVLADLPHSFFVTPSGSISANLPVYFPTDSIHLGDLGISIPDLLDPTNIEVTAPDFSSIDLSQLSLLDNILLAIDGIDLFLGGLQDLLDGEVGGVNLPLIGDKLSSAADFLADFRADFIATFREQVENVVDPAENIISTLLFDLLGSETDVGLGLLQDSNGDGDVDVEDVMLETNIDEAGIAPSEVYMQWSMKLGGSVANAGADIGFDIGIPGLGLETEGAIEMSLDWELLFGFGLSFQDGPYLLIGDDSELQLNLDVTVPGAAITGKLGFLQVEAVDQGDTHLSAAFGIDIYNRNDDTDERLGFAELGSIGIDAKIAAEAVVDLGLQLQLNSDLVPGADTVFPKIVADFTLDWGTDGFISLSDLDGSFLKEGLQYIAFENVGLDAGSFLSDVLGPIVDQIQQVTEPVQPIIDMLTSPIPVISDLAGPTTMLDLAQMFGLLNPGMISAIETVADVVTLINNIPDGDSLIVYFGDFVLFDADAGTGSGLDFSDASMDRSAIDKPTGQDFDQNLNNTTTTPDGPGSASKSAMQKIRSAGSFSFPILDDPAQIFGLLMGDPATLVQFDMKPLEFGFNYSQFFPIWGPLGVSINGEVSALIDFAFGYDTQGIMEFADSGFRNPELLFDGFYVSDWNADGTDVAEVQLDAGIWAAAELNLGVARAGVAGGIFAEIDFNLHDPNDDGKLRLAELATDVLNQAIYAPTDAEKLLAPLAVFDVHGDLYAKLFAFLKVDLAFFEIDKTWNITPPITILNFDIPFTRVPTLATELGDGVLQLNMGEFADQRLEGDTTDGDEQFVVKQADATHVWVWSTLVDFNGNGVYDQAEAQKYLVTSAIVGLGGEGNDTIDLSGVTADIDFDLEGGAGNDVIQAGAGIGYARMLGGSGNDTLWGGAGGDTIFGEAGADEIHGGGGNDWLIGDGEFKDAILGSTIVVAAKTADGNDTIYGDAGSDLLVGGGGADALEGGADADVLIGDGGQFTVDGSRLVTAIADTAKGSAYGNDTLKGGGGNDKLYAGKGNDSLEGGDNDDTLYGEAGFDTLKGDGGADTLYGGTENDIINGGAGNDKIFGEAGNDTVHGDDGNDTIDGGTGMDALYGDAGNDKLYGKSDPDKLYGGAGDDLLEGGAGNDLVLGGSDADTLIAGYGSDTLDGEAGGDLYVIAARGGSTTELTTVYDSGLLGDDPDKMIVNGTSGDDVFLLRAMADSYTFGGTDTAFVALINDGGANVERFNYRNLESLVVNGLFGDDYFASDDTKAVVTLNGGVGDDRFQIGQMFRSQRDTNPDVAHLAAEDQFGFTGQPEDSTGTIETTRGWLSNGISAPMTINGGEGNDEFTVFHNKAVLTLNGGDGDDLFTIRAFALKGTTDSERARTDLKGDAGADTILYAINAPVGIDGGDGMDTVKVIGTEFSDDFVITDNGVYGAGLYVTYVNVEKLSVDGAEGDDRFFVLSTSDSVISEALGGLGSDTFFVGGTPTNEPIPVVSNDLLGHSGIVLNSIENTGSNYDGLNIEGLSANVADNDEDFIVLRQSGGVSIVTEGAVETGIAADDEGWAYDTYALALTRLPEDDVYVTIQAPDLSPEDEAKGYATLEFWNADSATWEKSLVLHFTAANFDTPQTVKFRAIDDSGLEGTSFSMINHLVQSAGDQQYDGMAIPSVKVQINDNDRDGVIVTQTNNSTLVFEDPLLGTLHQDSYSVVLSHAPSADVTVVLTPVNDQVTLSAPGLTYVDGKPALMFTSANWNTAQVVTVTANDDSLVEGFRTEYITHTVTSDDGDVIASASYDVDGEPDVPGDQATIPADKPVDTLLLEHRPIDGTVVLTVDGAAVAADRFGVFGNTLVFFGVDGRPEMRSGTVHVSYDYVVTGYDGVAVNRVVAEVADNDAPGVVIIQSDGSTDVVEGGLFGADTYQVVLTKAPTADVTINVDPYKTRTTGQVWNAAENRFESFAFFELQVAVDKPTLTFTDADWFTPQTVTVTAIDDGVVDGSLTQVFAPTLHTLTDIKGPLFLEGAAGEGSVNLTEPLLLPGELNLRESHGDVQSFTAGTGYGAAETMTVATAGLQAAMDDPDLEGLDTLGDLVGMTLQISRGHGLDRFWQILDVTDVGNGFTQLTLKNPTQVDAGASEVPDADSEFAINALSNNFFVAEEAQVDFTMVFNDDSVADDVGYLTSAVFDGNVKGRIIGLGMGPDTVIGGQDVVGGITYDDMEVLRLDLGRGNDTLTVDYTSRRDDGFYTQTLVNTGLGNDTVIVDLQAGEDGALSLDTQAGDDTVAGGDSTLGLVVFGGTGNDTITGGSGDDILFGDRGRVDYVNQFRGDGLVVTRLGSTVPYTPTAPISFGADGEVTTIEDLAAAFPTTYEGLAGLQVSLIDENGHVQFSTITANDADTLSLAQPFTVEASKSYFYRISFLPEDQTDGVVRDPSLILSIDEALGGADTVTGNGGADTLIGGAAADTLYGDAGADIIAGDNLRIDFSPVAMLVAPKFGEDEATTLDLIQTVAPASGGGDTIHGGSGNDWVLGGAGGDEIHADDGEDIVLGDNGRLDFAAGVLNLVTATDPNHGGNDTIEGNDGSDILMGGTGGDLLSGDTGTLDGGSAGDMMFGDHGMVDFSLPVASNFTAIFTGAADGGGNDQMYGNGGIDIMLGQQGSDVMFGGDGDDDLWGGHNVAGGADAGDTMDGGMGLDVLAGDNAIIVRRDDALSPLVRALAGATLFNGGGEDNVTPDTAAAVTSSMQADPRFAGSRTRDITLLDHSDTTAAGVYGSDRMAGGGGADLLFGQLGDDVILGDGSVGKATFALNLGVEAVTDGDDYIEGNGGADTLYGNLGQDDIIGGSSDLFGLTAANRRPDGADFIYGGAGTDTGLDFADSAHARDADVILGDNGRIFRIVGTAGVAGANFITFNYDAAYGESIRVAPRAYDLLDYTAGDPAAGIGAADRIFGESGNDIIHGMKGDDILFGNAGDDDLYGGVGNDWMSGGRRVDGMLGDDGMIFTSRNGLTETLNGVNAVHAQGLLATSGNILTAQVYTTGELRKAVDLEPFDQGGNDILYGGLGDDFMHGGAGIDAMSGAEALTSFYDAAAGGFQSAQKPALVFDEATGRFTAFDNSSGTSAMKKVNGFFLNFDVKRVGGAGSALEDDDDRLFGDLSNDWLVGGTGTDHLYGGFGNDVMNADDNLDTKTGLNTIEDTGDLAGADIAFGGGGVDQLIGNAASDRLVDWSGEFNGYWVPQSQFGGNTAQRVLMPAYPEFLMDLAMADGADQTRYGLSTAGRHGEPYGELGLVLQQDPQWAAQTGAPSDPQPGNVSGGKKK